MRISAHAIRDTRRDSKAILTMVAAFKLTNETKNADKKGKSMSFTIKLIVLVCFIAYFCGTAQAAMAMHQFLNLQKNNIISFR